MSSYSEAESEAPRFAPVPGSAQVDQNVAPYYIGLFQEMFSVGRLTDLLQEEVAQYQNSLLDSGKLEQFKRELQQYIAAELYHINSVWLGVQDSIFNPSRGRGGQTEEQKRIVAAYMLGGALKKGMKNSRIRDFMKTKHALYQPFERLTSPFEIRPDSGLGKLWGVNQSVQFQSLATSPEYVLRTVRDWALAVKYLLWKTAHLEITVMKKLKMPMIVAEFQDEQKMRESYAGIITWLNLSPSSGTASTYQRPVTTPERYPYYGGYAPGTMTTTTVSQYPPTSSISLPTTVTTPTLFQSTSGGAKTDMNYLEQTQAERRKEIDSYPDYNDLGTRNMGRSRYGSYRS